MTLALTEAPRFFLPSEGTTRLGISLAPHGDGAEEGKKLVLDPTPAANEIAVAAGFGDFVDVTTADGTKYIALQVTHVEVDDEGLLFSVEAPKPWHVPNPPPTSADATQLPAESPLLQLRTGELTLAMEWATFDSVKTLVVLPITRGSGLSYARLLGAPRRGCVSTAAHKGNVAELCAAFAARFATHFLSWSFAQQWARAVAGFGAFIADNGLDPDACYGWISPLSQDQHVISDFTNAKWATIFERRLR